MTLDDPDWEPIWAAAQEYDLTVVIHSFTMSIPYPPGMWDNWDNMFLVRSASHVLNAQRNMAALIGSGVLDRYSSLRLTSLECGHGWLAFWASRLDEQAEMSQHALPRLKRKPSDYIRGPQYYQSIQLHEGELSLRQAIEAIGENTLMFATDYPHSESWFPKSVDAEPRGRPAQAPLGERGALLSALQRLHLGRRRGRDGRGAVAHVVQTRAHSGVRRLRPHARDQDRRGQARRRRAERDHARAGGDVLSDGAVPRVRRLRAVAVDLHGAPRPRRAARGDSGVSVVQLSPRVGLRRHARRDQGAARTGRQADGRAQVPHDGGGVDPRDARGGVRRRAEGHALVRGRRGVEGQGSRRDLAARRAAPVGSSRTQSRGHGRGRRARRLHGRPPARGLRRARDAPLSGLPPRRARLLREDRNLPDHAHPGPQRRAGASASVAAAEPLRCLRRGQAPGVRAPAVHGGLAGEPALARRGGRGNARADGRRSVSVRRREEPEDAGDSRGLYLPAGPGAAPAHGRGNVLGVDAGDLTGRLSLTGASRVARSCPSPVCPARNGPD